MTTAEGKALAAARQEARVVAWKALMAAARAAHPEIWARVAALEAAGEWDAADKLSAKGHALSESLPEHAAHEAAEAACALPIHFSSAEEARAWAEARVDQDDLPSSEGWTPELRGKLARWAGYSSPLAPEEHYQEEKAALREEIRRAGHQTRVVDGVGPCSHLDIDDPQAD